MAADVSGVNMNSQSFARELEVACALARRAGAVALEHYAGKPAIEYKGGDPSNPVTQADKDANAIIVAGLADAFPNDAILAEESKAEPSRHDHARMWCVDPIDGTREFIDHNGMFVVMIGLAIKGEATVGVLYQPTEDLLLWGAAGQAEMQRHGQIRPLCVSTQSDPSSATMVVSRSHASRSVERAAGRLGVGRKMPLGSVGLKVARIAEGVADLYISTSAKTHEWDACAPEAVLRAAGGRMTDVCGAPLKYNKENTATPRGMVASNGLVHDAALEALKPFAQERGWLDS
jgi:3'(2'), 5'-bisphosphate nucleotidase